MLIANSRGISIANVSPIASTGRPLDFSSNHTWALVADEVGHGNRNRVTSQSGYPPDTAVLATRTAAPPLRCRATPATVRPNATRPIKSSNAFSTSENSTCNGDATRFLSKTNSGKSETNDPTYWPTLLVVDHWTQA